MIVLGISCFYHDAAAAILRDGVLVAAAEEERFNRIKHDSEFPARAVDHCLHAAGVTIEQVDYICFYEKPLVKFDRILQTILARWPLTYTSWVNALPRWMLSKLNVARVIREQLKTDKPVHFCEHHLSHAA